MEEEYEENDYERFVSFDIAKTLYNLGITVPGYELDMIYDLKTKTMHHSYDSSISEFILCPDVRKLVQYLSDEYNICIYTKSEKLVTAYISGEEKKIEGNIDLYTVYITENGNIIYTSSDVFVSDLTALKTGVERLLEKDFLSRIKYGITSDIVIFLKNIEKKSSKKYECTNMTIFDVQSKLIDDFQCYVIPTICKPSQNSIYSPQYSCSVIYKNDYRKQEKLEEVHGNYIHSLKNGIIQALEKINKDLSVQKNKGTEQ